MTFFCQNARTMFCVGLPQRYTSQLRLLLQSQLLHNTGKRNLHISGANLQDNSKDSTKPESVKLSVTEITNSDSSENTSIQTDKANNEVTLKKKIPSGKSLRHPKLKEIHNLYKTPVDNRDLPRVYKESDDAASSTSRAVGMFLETSKSGKNKDTFLQALDLFNKKERVYKRGHVEFIYTAVKNSKEYGVEDDLDVYKAIIDVFPKGPLLPKSKWQTMFMPYPKQQQCAIDVMCAMENNLVMPDGKFGEILESVFSEESIAYQKYQRIMYWFGKIKHANPYPIPDVVPRTKEEWSSLVLSRMAVGLNNEITVWQTRDLEENPKEDTYIASVQCERQRELLQYHPADIPVRVEGGFNVWIGGHTYTYFKLKADAKNLQSLDESDYDDVSDLLDWSAVRFDDREATRPTAYNYHTDTKTEWNVVEQDSKKRRLLGESTIHEQPEETIYAMCITGSSSKDSLVQWIRCLQKTNPTLENIPVLFSLKSQFEDSLTVSNEENVPEVSSI